MSYTIKRQVCISLCGFLVALNASQLQKKYEEAAMKYSKW